MNRKDNDTEGFPERLDEAIRRSGVKKGELAKSLGVDAARVSDWLAGRSVPTGHHMIALVGALRCDANWLLTGALLGADSKKLERIRAILDEDPTDGFSSAELATGTPGESGNGGNHSRDRKGGQRSG